MFKKQKQLKTYMVLRSTGKAWKIEKRVVRIIKHSGAF